MQYKGGKHFQGKHIGAFVNEHRKPGQPYWEPFVGAMGALCHVWAGVGRVYASDACWPLVDLLGEVQRGDFVFPETISEEEYRRAACGEFSPALRAFILIGCSYGGRWRGGYARGRIIPREFAGTAARLLQRRMRSVPIGTKFIAGDYRRVGGWVTGDEQAFIYCDPPYRGTYDDRRDWASKTGFDSDEFFEWVRMMSGKGHDMLVSEYRAPGDFVMVVDLKNKRNMRVHPDGSKPYDRSETGEGLFVLRGSRLHERWVAGV